MVLKARKHYIKKSYLSYIQIFFLQQFSSYGFLVLIRKKMWGLVSVADQKDNSAAREKKN